VNVNATSSGRRLARPCNIDRTVDWEVGVT
jgi:hypothetical protein